MKNTGVGRNIIFGTAIFGACIIAVIVVYLQFDGRLESKKVPVAAPALPPPVEKIQHRIDDNEIISVSKPELDQSIQAIDDKPEDRDEPLQAEGPGYLGIDVPDEKEYRDIQDRLIKIKQQMENSQLK